MKVSVTSGKHRTVCALYLLATNQTNQQPDVPPALQSNYGDTNQFFSHCHKMTIGLAGGAPLDTPAHMSRGVQPTNLLANQLHYCHWQMLLCGYQCAAYVRPTTHFLFAVSCSTATCCTACYVVAKYTEPETQTAFLATTSSPTLPGTARAIHGCIDCGNLQPTTVTVNRVACWYDVLLAVYTCCQPMHTCCHRCTLAVTSVHLLSSVYTCCHRCTLAVSRCTLAVTGVHLLSADAHLLSPVYTCCQPMHTCCHRCTLAVSRRTLAVTGVHLLSADAHLLSPRHTCCHPMHLLLPVSTCCHRCALAVTRCTLAVTQCTLAVTR